MDDTEHSDITEEIKNCLQGQVEELKFVDRPFKLTAFKCCSCQNLAINHRFANCEDVFCNNCYLDHHNKTCPNCEQNVETNSQDLEFEKALFALKVECKYKTRGCKEVIVLRDFLMHINVCKFTTENLLPRLYQGNPTTEALQKLTDEVNYLKQAMESLQAENRQTHDMAAMLKELTDADLGSQQINKQMKIEIRQIKDALKESEKKNELLRVKNEEIRKMRLQQKRFLEDLQIKFSVVHGTELTELKYFNEGPLSETPSNVVLWKVKWCNKKQMDNNCLIKSQEFFCISDGIKFKPWLEKDPGENSVHIKLDFSRDLIDKEKAPEPFFHSRKYILLEQSNALKKNNLEFVDCPHVGMNSIEKMMLPSFHYSCFFPVSLLKEENRYLKNGRILIVIILEPISLLSKQVASSNGVLLWKIDNYSKKKKDEVDGMKECLVSKPFKTSEKGHYLQVGLYLNGSEHAKGQYLSIFSTAIMLESDSPSFKCKLTYHILDQSDSHPKADIIYDQSKDFDSKNSIRGFFKFELQNRVENLKYLKNDSILIKVVAQVL